MPADYSYPPGDFRRYNIPGDGITNVKKIFQYLFSLNRPIYVPKPTASYYLGAIGDNENVFDLTGLAGVRIYGNAAKFTFLTPSSTSARLFNLDGTTDVDIDGIVAHCTNYTIATRQTTGVAAVGIAENASAACSRIRVRLHAINCRSGLEVLRSSVRHFDFDIDIKTTDCYYGVVFGGGGEHVSGSVETSGAVRSYFVYGVKDHDVRVVSSGTNAISTGDLVLKTFADNEDLRNIAVRYSATGTNSTSYAVRIEHSQNSSGTAAIKNVDIWMDDSGNTQGDSVVLSATRNAVAEGVTDNRFENICIRGSRRGQIAFDTQPSSKGLLCIWTDQDYGARPSQWSLASEGYVFKQSDSRYWQCAKGNLGSKAIDIPISRFVVGTEFCVEMSVYVIADRGTTSSSAVRFERFVVFGYMGGAVQIRHQESLESTQTTVNLAIAVAAIGNNLRVSFSGAALTADGAASVTYGFI